jgi:anti-sigma regulatory factor (Ser/Thr protein kinase)
VLAEERIGGVDADAPSLHLDLDPTPAAARQARVFFADHVELDGETADAAALCVSELVTNGVLHARTPLVVGVTLGAEQVFVCVADRAPGQPAPQPSDDSRPSGRGLVLVEALADQWGVCTTDGGKAVWFTVARRQP